MLCKLLPLPFSRLKHCWTTHLPGVVANHFGQMGKRHIPHWCYVSAPLTGQEGRDYSRLLSKFSNILVPKQAPPVSLLIELIFLPCIIKQFFVLGTAFALGWISSASLPPGWSATELPEVATNATCSMVRWDQKILSTVGGAVIQPPAWEWANQILGTAKLLI